MATYAIHAQKFFLPAGPVGPGYLMVEDGRFGAFSEEAPEGVEIVDRSDQWVAPGLVDTHIHGFDGHDVMDLDPEGLDAMCAGLVRNGCTSFLPTTLTAPEDRLDAACAMVGEHVNKPKQAQVRGIFLEGPWFSETYKGAQNPAFMGDPKLEVMAGWMERLNGRAFKIAIAPEREGAEEFCARATELGAVVALGHSNATYEEACAAVNNGASIFVHTYNAMSPLHHRNPGMVGAALTCPDVFAEIICDGNHVNPASVGVVAKARGSEETVLITDCLAAGGMPEGDYEMEGLPITVKDGQARLKESGNLAGSIVGLCQCVKNVVDWNLVTPAQAIAMASINPAKSVGIDDVCGSIKPGRDADMAVFTPSMDLVATYVQGELAWEE